ncbi:MAG: hypothetical protein Q9159_000139 [Coniocarpon cinnabarinum]
MEDLSGLEWNAKSPSNSRTTPSTIQPPIRSTLSPSLSGRSTPLSAQTSGTKPQTIQNQGKPLTSDSFSTLLAPQPSKPAGVLSLAEKQKQLQTLSGTWTKNGQDPYNLDDSKFWEGLGSGRGTPAPGEHERSSAIQDTDNDLLAEFNSGALSQTTRSSSASRTSQNIDLNGRPKREGPKQQQNPDAVPQTSYKRPRNDFPSADDPFGLGHISVAKPAGKTTNSAVDDDILGDLGKPISELDTRKHEPARREDSRSISAPRTSKDKALAELVDMGFSVERAQYALDQTQGGHDVQAAISVLLNEAHGTGRTRAEGNGKQGRRTSNARSERQGRASNELGATKPPPWLNGTTKASTRSMPKTSAAAVEEKELSQYAAEFGNSMWKSANTFWKTSQKRVAKAVADLQQDPDPSQPRWLRDGQPEPGLPEPDRRHREKQAVRATDEAAMLDAPREVPSGKARRPPEGRAQSTPATNPTQRQDAVAPQVSSAQTRPQSARPDSRPKNVQRLNRQLVEDESAQAYISPARRRKQQNVQSEPKVEEKAKVNGESLDIFSTAPLPQPSAHSSTTAAPSPKVSFPVRPKTRPRQAQSIPDSALQTSHRHRKAGTEAFRRGDYVAANSSYSSALDILPNSHPIAIVLRCNRAITSLKAGDAKSAVKDADAALETIGPSKGEDESIVLATDEGQKPMKEYYGKALMRKAEAMEHLEKWQDAAKVWREAVEVGVGGAVAIQGRNRCEKAARGDRGGTVNGNSAKSKAPAKAKPRPSAKQDLSFTQMEEGEAVKRLRAAEAAAAQASDEAFALTDAVEARIASWKGGKADNLRALLASLDTILWADAGWSKVNMGDLVLPNKVKIIYMKAIAKVHPDKIAQNATVEQKMISATVFAALNEAWDKFKKDNGL